MNKKQNEKPEIITKEEKQKRGLLPLTSDIVFKRVFSREGNEKILKSLLEAILDTEIQKVEVKNPEITKNYADEKLGVLDIRAQIDKDIMLNIEMQVANVKTMVNRNIAYTSRLIAEDTRVRETYGTLKKFISITILGENLLKRNTYHSIAHLKFEDIEKEKQINMGYRKEQGMLTDRLEIHYIELKKFLKKKPEMNNKLEQWLWLLIGEEEKVRMASKKNKTIEKVVEDLDEMSADENERLEAYKRKLAIWDYNLNIEEAKEEGLQEGMRKIAKKMQQKGIDVKEIIEITGLTEEEISNLSSDK